MVSNNESQCYFIQLQFDTYLDCELSQVQREAFQGHLQQCATCASEFAYAQRLHDRVLDFPQVDCNDSVLESLYKHGGGDDLKSTSRSPMRLWEQIQDLFNTAPVFVRYAVPVMLLVVVVLPFVGQDVSAPAPVQVAEQPATEQYTREELQQALADLNLAIEYLNGVGQRTEVLIGDRFLITPLQDSLEASFEVIRRVNSDLPQDDPIY